MPNAKRRSVALRSIASRSFWRYHEWRERERDKSAAAAAAAVSDGESTWAIRVAGVSDLPTLRHHSSQHPNPHVSHCNISSSSFFVSYDFVFSKFFFFLLLLLFSGWSFNAIITCSMSPKAFAISVPHFPFWTLSESLSLSLSHTHTRTLCFCCLNRSQFSVIVFFFGLNWNVVV